MRAREDRSRINLASNVTSTGTFRSTSTSATIQQSLASADGVEQFGSASVNPLLLKIVWVQFSKIDIDEPQMLLCLHRIENLDGLCPHCRSDERPAIEKQPHGRNPLLSHGIVGARMYSPRLPSRKYVRTLESKAKGALRWSASSAIQSVTSE